MPEYEDEFRAQEAMRHVSEEWERVAKAGKPLVFREGTRDEYTRFPNGETVYTWNLPFEDRIDRYRTHAFSVPTGTQDVLSSVNAAGHRHATWRELEYFLDHVPKSLKTEPLLALGDLEKGSRRIAYLWNPHLKPQDGIQRIDLEIMTVQWTCGVLAIIT